MLLRAQGSGRSLKSADVVVGRHWNIRVWCVSAIDTDLGSTVGCVAESRGTHVGSLFLIICRETHLRQFENVRNAEREADKVGLGGDMQKEGRVRTGLEETHISKDCID